MSHPVSPFNVHAAILKPAPSQSGYRQHEVDRMSRSMRGGMALSTLERHEPSLHAQAQEIFGDRARFWIITEIPFYGMSPVELLALGHRQAVQDDLSLQHSRLALPGTESSRLKVPAVQVR